MAASGAERDLQALELRRAGVSVSKIMTQLAFKTRASCERAIARAMNAQGLTTDPLELRRAELDRLERLQAAIWPKALRGDAAAVGHAMKLAEMRLRIAGIQEAGLTPLTAAYDRTVAALDIDPDVDAALVAFGRRYCEQVDAASGLGDPLAVTKALHLMPHVTNVLRELGATPAARDAFRQAQAAEVAAESPNVTSIDDWSPGKLAGS